MRHDVNCLIGQLGLPTLVTTTAKGLIDETLPTFKGVFAHHCSHPSVLDIVQGCDMVLCLGAATKDVKHLDFITCLQGKEIAQ